MLYIHIPYCKGKCIYCNFYSGGNPDWEKYFKTLASELTSRIDELRSESLSSIYFGGGTPSLIPERYIEAFFKFMYDTFQANGIGITANPEVTLEANPEDITEEKARCWRECGINRVSVGVQSLYNDELQLINRRHSAEKAIDSIGLLKQYFNNISVDVIYGFPGQNKAKLISTLDKIIELRPQHVSVYALTYEENTPLHVMRENGRLKECSEEEYLCFDRLITKRLGEAGFDRYEISNYSQPGFRSRHNGGYWSGEPYVGLGPSACSYDGVRTRRTNLPDIRSYLAGNIQYECETLSVSELEEECIMTRLRTKEGILLDRFADIFGEERLQNLLKKAERWIESSHLYFTDSRGLSLTEKGIPVSDYIILSLA